VPATLLARADEVIVEMRGLIRNGTTELVGPTVRAARIPATPSIKWEFLLPQFRSKINPHPAVTTRLQAEVCRDDGMAPSISQLKEVTMARPYLPSFFGRGDDPFGSLFREVQKTFEDFSQRTPFARFSADTLSPKIDIAESKDAIDVTAELPGVDEKDLDATLANGVLTIRGEKKTERDEQDKDKNWHVVERSYGSFSRAIPLPFDPDPAKVEAKFDKGVLHIHLPKPAEVAQEQQKIEIKKG
jgi:HSP20 family protein